MTSRIDKAKMDTNLPDLIGQEVSLRWNGRSHVGLCPFHAETSPSFNVREQRYHCFGCGAKGDALDWCRNKLGMSFAEALNFLAGEEARQEFNVGGFIGDPGDFELRRTKCREHLTGSTLVRAILEPRIPKELRKYVHISVGTVPDIDELELISGMYRLSGDTLGQYEALRIWEDLITQRWIPY